MNCPGPYDNDCKFFMGCWQKAQRKKSGYALLMIINFNGECYHYKRKRIVLLSCDDCHLPECNFIMCMELDNESE